MQQLTDIEKFQGDNLNHLGEPLDVDGAIGPETRWAMSFLTLSSVRKAVIREGQKYIGLVEDPPRSNSDPDGIIKSWLERCWVNEPAPWCAAATSAWLSVVLPVKIAGAVRLGQHFPSTDNPWAGDLFWYPTDDRGHGHIGLVIGVGSKQVMTLEGNSDNRCRVIRRPRAGLKFSRTFDDTLGICPAVILAVPLVVGGGTR